MYRIKERELGGEILVHVGVIIEMVMAEVCERDDIEHNSINTIRTQGLGTHLECYRTHFTLAHPSKKGMQFTCLRRGEPAHDCEVANVTLSGRT